jgi:hypothetical protein
MIVPAWELGVYERQGPKDAKEEGPHGVSITLHE